MADWDLTFRAPSRTITVEACQHILQPIFGTDVTTTSGDVEGNPYDGYFGGAYIDTRSPDGSVRVCISLTQNLSSPTDRTPYTTLSSVWIHELDATAPTYPHKLAAWRALRSGFAAIGYTDETGPSGRIIGDAERAGDTETAAFVRGQPRAAS